MMVLFSVEQIRQNDINLQHNIHRRQQYRSIQFNTINDKNNYDLFSFFYRSQINALVGKVPKKE